jgi:uncharacterized protein (TIGR02145 family)
MSGGNNKTQIIIALIGLLSALGVAFFQYNPDFFNNLFSNKNTEKVIKSEPLVPVEDIIKPPKPQVKKRATDTPNVGRTDKKYDWVILRDGKKWMTKNLPGLYSWEEAKDACPEGWKLPSDNEWWNMIEKYDGAYNEEVGKPTRKQASAGIDAYEKLKTGGEAGFNATLDGYKDSNTGEVKYADSVGYYWTDISTSHTHAFYYHFNSMPHGASAVARSTNKREYLFSCRCIEARPR